MNSRYRFKYLAVASMFVLVLLLKNMTSQQFFMPYVLLNLFTSKDDTVILNENGTYQCTPMTFYDKYEDIEPIPKYLHFVYKSTSLPEPYAKIVEKCIKLNPSYQVVLWTDKTADKMISENFSFEAYTLYKKITIPIEMADVMRQFILYKYGGIYMDLDIECHKPFDSDYPNNNVSCEFTVEQYLQTKILWGFSLTLQNCAIVCRPKHPFIKFVLNRIDPGSKSGVLDKTGPFFIHRLFNKYNKVNHTFRSQVTLGNPERFNSIPAPAALNRCTGDKEKLSADCKGLLKLGPTNITYAIHRFMALGYNNRRDQLKHYDMCEFTPHLRTYQSEVTNSDNTNKIVL